MQKEEETIINAEPQKRNTYLHFQVGTVMDNRDRAKALLHLARKLKLLREGVDNNFIHGDIRNLPLEYDPSHLPIEVKDRDEMNQLLLQFYSRKTRCVCRMRGCSTSMQGFQEIIVRSCPPSFCFFILFFFLLCEEERFELMYLFVFFSINA